MSNHKTTFSTDPCILELRALIEQLEAQANHSPGATKMVPPPVGRAINVVMDGDPPAPHEKWEDWLVELFETRTIKGVCLRSIAPGDFSVSREVAEPAPVAGVLARRIGYELSQIRRAIEGPVND